MLDKDQKKHSHDGENDLLIHIPSALKIVCGKDGKGNMPKVSRRDRQRGEFFWMHTCFAFRGQQRSLLLQLASGPEYANANYEGKKKKKLQRIIRIRRPAARRSSASARLSAKSSRFRFKIRRYGFSASRGQRAAQNTCVLKLQLNSISHRLRRLYSIHESAVYPSRERFRRSCA